MGVGALTSEVEATRLEARQLLGDLSEEEFRQAISTLHESELIHPADIVSRVRAGRAAAAGGRGGAPPMPEDQVRRELEEALVRLRRGPTTEPRERPTMEAIAEAHVPSLTARGLRSRFERYPHLRSLLDG